MSGATSRWLVLGLLAIGLVGTGVVATDAGLLSANERTTLDERPDHDDLGNETGVVAEPADGPNGAYAYLDADGELVIDLTVDNDALEGDGVPESAVTGIGDVFTLTNTGDERARVWLEHDADHVAFRTGEGESIEGANEAAVLEPAESIRVGFVVDARDLESEGGVVESLRFRTATLESEDGRDSADSHGGTDSSTVDPSPSVEVVEPDAKTRTITVSDVRGRTVPIDLGSLRVGEGVVLEGVTIRFDDVEDATFEVRADGGRETGDGQPQPLPAGVSTIGAVDVEDAPPGGAIESVEYRFAIDRSRIEGRESATTAESEPAVAFYRSAGDGWKHRRLKPDDETGIAGGDVNGDDGSTTATRYTATVTADSLASGIVGAPGTDDGASTSARTVPVDSDGGSDDGAATETGGADADSGSVDGSGGPVPAAFVGVVVLMVWLRKLTRG
ncbi:hypothetical protein [Halopiger thermotolerans]